MTPRRFAAVVTGLALLAGAVILVASQNPETPLASGSTIEISVPLPGEIPVTGIEAPKDIYDPVDAGEPVPDGYRHVLPRDAILPIYNPTFKTVAATDWPADSLVIGVVIAGDARAYPVKALTRREMVIDTIAGTPVMVTW